MQLKNTFEQFGAVSKTLHWLIFISVTLQFYLIWIFESLSKEDPTRGNYMFLHKSVGATILLLTIAWIIWRRRNVLPQAFPSQNSWQHYLSKFVHIALFATLLAMPLTGLFMSMAAGRGLDYFGLFTIAPLIPQNEVLSGQLKTAHTFIAFMMMFLVALHGLGALVHHFVYKDNVLRRMLFCVKLK